jgi:ATP-dependent RNA helicase DeaD
MLVQDLKEVDLVKKRSLVMVGVLIFICLFVAVAFANNQVKIVVNGQEIDSDVAPQIIKDRTMVPVRWVAEALGADVRWEPQSKTVYIDKPHYISSNSEADSKLYPFQESNGMYEGVCIVTGTPGRVYDHIRQGNLNTRNIRFLILDEADRMLDMGFLDQVQRIIQTLPKNRVTLLFSATIPAEIRNICSKYMKNPTIIEIESPTMTVDTIQQRYYRVNHNEKNTQLHRLLLVEQPESCMIFCNTRNMVDRVQRFLTRQGYASRALHGDIPQVKRLKTLQQFKQGYFRLLVATDVAARGIHIDDLSLVINYDVPLEKDSYVHRIGRTGRAGNGGQAITLVTSDDIMTLYEIEEHIGVMIPEAELPSEELLNERKASIEEWAQANSLKVEPSQKVVEYKAGSDRNRPSQPKSKQQRNKKSKHSLLVAPEPETSQNSNSKHSADDVITVRIIIKPAVMPDNTADKADTPDQLETVQQDASSNRDPWFKRLVQRIRGK